jgi:Flp pilus assembly protein TadB
MAVKEKVKKRIKKTKKVMDETQSFLTKKAKEKLGEAKQKKVFFLGLLKIALVVVIAALVVPLLEEFQVNLSFFLLLALIVILLYLQAIAEKG